VTPLVSHSETGEATTRRELVVGDVSADEVTIGEFTATSRTTQARKRTPGCTRAVLPAAMVARRRCKAARSSVLTTVK
jgi:hypothetical protein